MKKVVVVSLFFVASAALLVASKFVTPKKSSVPSDFSETLRAPDRLVSRDCGEDLSLKPEWQCYWLTLSDSGQVPHTLPGAVFRSKSAMRYDDPLVFIGGGPGESGQSMEGALLFWQDWLASAGIERDFVVLEPRGAGFSRPSLECARYEHLSKELINEPLTFAEEMRLLQPVLEACFNDLESEGVNLNGFTSLQNARDLEAFLTELGYQRWNYLGVSYGSRVALIAAMHQPQVNKIVLDSPYPLHRGRLDQVPELWARAILSYLKDESPGVVAMFSQLVKRLREQPQRVRSQSWTDDTFVDWVLNDERLYALVFQALYNTELRENVVELLAYLYEVEEEASHPMLEYFYNEVFSPGFSSLLYFATECNDNPLVSKESFEQGLQQAGELKHLFESDWALDLCRWSHFTPGQLPDMVPLSAPALVVVGEKDPITTVKPSRELMQSLPNGVLLELNDKAHAEFYASDCARRLIPAFLKGRDIREMRCVSGSE